MKISEEQCGYCGACVAVCTHNVLELSGMRVIIHPGCENCTLCGVVCPMGAINNEQNKV